MGYTDFTVERIEFILAQHNPKKVLDLGAQNMYNQPLLPAPYAQDWYKAKGIDYTSIDISGENDSWALDLSKRWSQLFPFEDEYGYPSYIGHYDFIADCGTLEHIGNNGKFDIESIYNAWQTKFYFLRKDGIMYNENPKTGNWPKHGFNYYTQEFYFNLAAVSDLEILGIGEHAACNNYVDGWNVWSILKKTGPRFPTLEEFSLLGIKES